MAAVPAVMLVSFFRGLLLPSLGFAAGAIMYVVFSEFIPVAGKNQKAKVHGLVEKVVICPHCFSSCTY
ncbi:MAG: hypothetical protein V3U10_00845 [Bacteroidota bacterium]